MKSIFVRPSIQDWPCNWGHSNITCEVTWGYYPLAGMHTHLVWETSEWDFYGISMGFLAQSRTRCMSCWYWLLWDPWILLIQVVGAEDKPLNHWATLFFREACIFQCYQLYVYLYMYICICICTCVCIMYMYFRYVYIYIHIHVCVYVYLYTRSLRRCAEVAAGASPMCIVFWCKKTMPSIASKMW